MLERQSERERERYGDERGREDKLVGTQTQVEGERAGEGTAEEDPPHRIFNFFNSFNFFKEIQGFGMTEAQKT